MLQWIAQLLGRDEALRPEEMPRYVKGFAKDGFSAVLVSFAHGCGHTCYWIELESYDEADDKHGPIAIIPVDDLHAIAGVLHDAARYIDSGRHLAPAWLTKGFND